jgi:hypothetical protein
MPSCLPQSLVCMDGTVCSRKSAIAKGLKHQPVGNKSHVFNTSPGSHVFAQQQTFHLPFDQSVVHEPRVYIITVTNSDYQLTILNLNTHATLYIFQFYSLFIQILNISNNC